MKEANLAAFYSLLQDFLVDNRLLLRVQSRVLSKIFKEYSLYRALLLSHTDIFILLF